MCKTSLDNAARRSPATAVWSDFCAVAPSPQLRERLKAELAQAKAGVSPELAANMVLARQPRPLGFDDGVIIPPDQFPSGTASRTIAAAAAERAPLRGDLQVVVVLVDFDDRPMTQDAAHFQDLFFSTGVVPHGSVSEYFQEVTGGLVESSGQVVGPVPAAADARLLRQPQLRHRPAHRAAARQHHGERRRRRRRPARRFRALRQ